MKTMRVAVRAFVRASVRASALAFLLVAVALAGCSGPPGLERDDDTRSVPGGSDGGDGGGGSGGDDLPPPAPRPARSALLLAFDLEDCSGLESVLELEADSAQALLPDGYTVHASSTATGGDAATARYVWAQCGGLRTASSFVNDTAFGFVDLRIEAPEEAAEADEHWYRFRVLAKEDVLARLWDAAGYEVYAAAYSDASQASGSPLGGLGTGVEDRTVELGAYGSQGVASTASSGVAVRSAHYTQTDEGRIEWVGSYEPASVRDFRGDFRVPADDPLASTQTGGVTQRYLDAAAWTANDLWLRAPDA